jgi:hypothetical protein
VEAAWTLVSAAPGIPTRDEALNHFDEGHRHVVAATVSCWDGYRRAGGYRFIHRQ